MLNKEECGEDPTPCPSLATPPSPALGESFTPYSSFLVPSPSPESSESSTPYNFSLNTFSSFESSESLDSGNGDVFGELGRGV